MITGGSTGIGFALAQQFVREGAHVILIARTKNRLDTAVAELKKVARAKDRDVNIRGFPADTTNSSQVACMPHPTGMQLLKEPNMSLPPLVQVAAALKYAGDVDVLVCCAGASYPGMVLHSLAMPTQYFTSAGTAWHEHMLPVINVVRQHLEQHICGDQ